MSHRSNCVTNPWGRSSQEGTAWHTRINTHPSRKAPEQSSTMTRWLSGRALVACMPCTICARWASRCASTTAPLAWAAPGGGTAIPVRGSIFQAAPSIATPSQKSSCGSGTGPRPSPLSPRCWPIWSTSPTGSTSAATSSSRPGCAMPATTKRRSAGGSRPAPASTSRLSF